MYYASGTHIHSFPKHGVLITAQLSDQGQQVSFIRFLKILMLSLFFSKNMRVMANFLIVLLYILCLLRLCISCNWSNTIEVHFLSLHSDKQIYRK